ncbi:MAG: TetR/AcrR family transcriptional regulator [Nevskiales bacterium]
MPRADRASTRRQLLAAGLNLAQQRPLASLRIDDLVQAAGVAKGTFYLHFKDRAEYLVTLHSNLHDEVMRNVQHAVAGQAPSLERLLLGSFAYLDACRRGHPVKALLMEARVEPAIQMEVQTQNARFAQRAEREFAAARWPESRQAARLWVGMMVEAALAEAEANAPLPEIRSNLRRFLNFA